MGYSKPWCGHVLTRPFDFFRHQKYDHAGGVFSRRNSSRERNDSVLQARLVGGFEAVPQSYLPGQFQGCINAPTGWKSWGISFSKLFSGRPEPWSTTLAHALGWRPINPRATSSVFGWIIGVKVKAETAKQSVEIRAVMKTIFRSEQGNQLVLRRITIEAIDKWSIWLGL